jgi:integrase
MTHIRIKGFQIFEDRHGKKRCYHRKTRYVIDLERNPVGSSGFINECARITDIEKANKSLPPKKGTLGGLLQSYFQTEHFENLADSTKQDYRKCADFVYPITNIPISTITTPLVAGIHDKAAKKIGWRRANMVRTLLSQVFKYTIPMGLIEKNYAEHVIPKPRPKDAKRANRPWTYEEVDIVLGECSPQMRAALALIYCTGLDPTDALCLSRAQVQSNTIWKNRNKTKEGAAVPIGATLRVELDRAPTHDAPTVLANSKGASWTYSGFQSNFQRLKKKLEANNLIEPGLTPKGLRHTMATWLREAGSDERTISDLLAQKSPAMGLHYSRDANLERKNSRTIEIWEEEKKRRSTLVKPSK